MSPEYKRLYRSRRERMIAGVCGGIGEYVGLDPTLVRLLFVLLAITGGSGLLVYLIMMVIIPEEPLPASDEVVAPDVSEEDTAAKE